MKAGENNDYLKPAYVWVTQYRTEKQRPSSTLPLSDPALVHTRATNKGNSRWPVGATALNALYGSCSIYCISWAPASASCPNTPLLLQQFFNPPGPKAAPGVSPSLSAVAGSRDLLHTRNTQRSLLNGTPCRGVHLHRTNSGFSQHH